MKKNMMVIIFFYAFVFLLAFPIQAQIKNQQETLKQYVSELQNNPSNDELREKIIKLVLDMKVNPAIPKEAIKYKGAWQYAFKEAKTEMDFANAAKEYEKVLLLAPWSAEDYFNSGTTYEKAGNIAEAIKQFNFYLLAAPYAKDANDVLQHIGALEYKEQKIAVELKRKTEEEQAYQIELNKKAEEEKARKQREFEKHNKFYDEFRKIDLSGRWYLIDQEDKSLYHFEFNTRLVATSNGLGDPLLECIYCFDKDYTNSMGKHFYKGERREPRIFYMTGDDLHSFSSPDGDIEGGLISTDNKRIEYISPQEFRYKRIFIKE